MCTEPMIINMVTCSVAFHLNAPCGACAQFLWAPPPPLPRTHAHTPTPTHFFLFRPAPFLSGCSKSLLCGILTRKLNLNSVWLVVQNSVSVLVVFPVYSVRLKVTSTVGKSVCIVHVGVGVQTPCYGCHLSLCGV
jgi:hypothetical protein